MEEENPVAVAEAPDGIPLAPTVTNPPDDYDEVN